VIDAMRGASILLVLIHHFHIAYRLDQGIFASLLSARFVRAVARNGNYGVTIFFAISGFLITSTSLERFRELKSVSLRAFYSFRFARIAPNLALILAIVVPLALAGVPVFASKPGSASMGLTVLSILTFTHNELMQKYAFYNYCLNILWSLSVEEMFYFTFPLVCVMLRRDTWIVALWAAVAIFAPIHRYHYKDNELVALYGYFSCFDGIAIGCIAAVLGRQLSLSRVACRVSRYLAAAVIVYVYLSKNIGANVVYGVSAVALAAGVILLGTRAERAIERPARNIASKTLGWFGLRLWVGLERGAMNSTSSTLWCSRLCGSPSSEMH
jgi:peptidoglycan/LPS O-acetylase OafA/YrhL